MANTVTYAKTKTFTRIGAIKRQFRTLLRRATSISLETLEKLEKGLDDPWIAEVSVYGLDKQKLCRAQLILKIDWNEYKLQIDAGRATVAVDEKKWVDETAIEVDECIRLFNDFVEEKSLITEWVVVFAASVRADDTKLKEVRNTLGLQPREPFKWAKKGQGWLDKISELPELRVGCYLVDD